MLLLTIKGPKDAPLENRLNHYDVQTQVRISPFMPSNHAFNYLVTRKTELI